MIDAAKRCGTMHRTLFVGLLTGLIVLAGPGAATGVAQSRTDWTRIASSIVRRGLELEPGERVALFWDQSSDRGATSAVRAAIAGAVVVEANVPSMVDLELSNRLDPAIRAHQLARRDSSGPTPSPTSMPWRLAAQGS